MINKFSDISTLVSDTIHSYIKDGYHIDAKESAINHEKDKDCTFKVVLKRDVDGIECKVVITFTDKCDDKNKSYLYHKIDTVDDTIWSEETCTYNLSTAAGILRETGDGYIKQHDRKDIKLERKYPSTYQSIDDYIKLSNEEKDDSDELEDSLSRLVRYIFST